MSNSMRVLVHESYELEGFLVHPDSARRPADHLEVACRVTRWS